MKGDKIAAFANKEPAAGSDASGIEGRETPAEGGCNLKGTRMFITSDIQKRLIAGELAKEWAP